MGKFDVESEAAQAAATATRERMKAIITSPEAVGREELAKHLAFNTDFSPLEARLLLSKSPISAAGATQHARLLPGVDADQSLQPLEESASASWKSVAEKLNDEAKAGRRGFVMPIVSH